MEFIHIVVPVDVFDHGALGFVLANGFWNRIITQRSPPRRIPNTYLSCNTVWEKMQAQMRKRNRYIIAFQHIRL